MTLEEINSIIESQGVYEILYQKDSTEHLWHISNIEISKEYQGKCILAFCHEVEKDLTFSISRIISAKRYWIEILNEDLIADNDGLYVMACMEDNYVGRRVAYIRKGVRFYDFGWALAYHKVPAFSPALSERWLSIEKDAPRNSLSLFAYKGDAKIDCSYFHLVNNEGGINYYLYDMRYTHVREVPVNEDSQRSIIILGRYDFAAYDERNLGAHNYLWAKHNKQ